MAFDIHQKDKESPSPRNPTVQSGPEAGLPWSWHYPEVTEDAEGTQKVLFSGLLTVPDIPVLLSCLLPALSSGSLDRCSLPRRHFKCQLLSHP